MAGKASRDKGYRGEREALALLQPIVDEVCDELNEVRFELRRDQRQRFEAKHYDLVGIPWLAIEVKRRENIGQINTWWRQTLAATREGQTAVLMYRPNNTAWQVRMRVPILAGDTRILATVTVGFETFKVWFREKLKSHLRK